MISVSDAWKAKMNADTSYTTSATVTLTDGTVLTLTSAKICVKTNRYTDGPAASVFPVGEAMSRTMQIEVQNADEAYSGYDFLGASVMLYLHYGSESITIGKYTVVQPATYGETVIITGQDDMCLADKPFATSLTYPSTAGALWTEICTSCGLSNGMSTIPQGAAEIATAPSTSLTYRAVLGYIAMLSGGNARIDRLGNLKVVNYDMTGLADMRGGDVTGIDDGQGNISLAGGATASGLGGDLTITGGVFSDDGDGNITWTSSGSWDAHNLDRWRSLRVDVNDVTITGIQTTVTDADGESSTLLVGTDDYALTLENPLWEGREQAALTTVLSAIGNVPFRGFNGEYIAYPLAEFGDLCRIVDRRRRIYYSIITDVDFTWSAPTTLGNSAQAPLRATASYTSPVLAQADRLVRAERTSREAAVGALAAALAASGGMYETTETPSGGGTIYYLHDKPLLANSEIVLKLTATALGISTDGGQTYPTGWNFATGTTITYILQTNGINADWINAGSLTVLDDDDNIIFKADKDNESVQIAGWSADAEHLQSTGTATDSSGEYTYFLKLGKGTIETSGGEIRAMRCARQWRNPSTMQWMNYAGSGLSITLPTDYDSSTYDGYDTAIWIQSHNGPTLLTLEDYGGNVVAVLNGNLNIGDSNTSHSLMVNGTDVLGAINSVYGKFERSTHTVLSAGTITAGGYISGTETFTKSGYYPLAIAGWNASGTGSTYVIPMRFHIDTASNGSVTVGYLFRNSSTTADVTSATVTVDILWVRTS